jgi:hypothetical protein
MSGSPPKVTASVLNCPCSFASLAILFLEDAHDQPEPELLPSVAVAVVAVAVAVVPQPEASALPG